jgi:hypothetical protein
VDKAREAAAMAGLAENTHFPSWQRLQCSKQALDFYVDQAVQLEELLEKLDELAPTDDAFADAADMLRAILNGDETPPGTEKVAEGVYVVRQRDGVIDGTQLPLADQ